jgi:hypothetical protein
VDSANPVVRLCADGMAGDPTAFARAWEARVDDFDACVAAHYLARVQPDPQATFEWNARAIEHARLADPELVRAFMPSLYLNLGRSYEDIGDAARAADEYRRAESCLDALDDDGYGALVRRGVAAGLERTAGIASGGLDGGGDPLADDAWSVIPV